METVKAVLDTKLLNAAAPGPGMDSNCDSHRIMGNIASHLDITSALPEHQEKNEASDEKWTPPTCPMVG
jgi:hypothetical protein